MAARNISTCEICRIQRPTERLVQCSNCRPGGSSSFYCAAHCSESDCNHAENCRQEGHENCWDAHLPRKGRQKHEKIDAFPDYVARLILHSEPKSEIQAQNHERDRRAEWFTVNSGPFEESEATVQITERFRKLCDPRYVSNRSSSESYPSIVSFIGDTGVGKSTLVNAMSVIGQIQSQLSGASSPSGLSPTNSLKRPSNLPKVEQTRREGPVTRSGDPRRATEPTSSGVHLYLDPGVNKVRYHPSREPEAVPLLYADCEGFGGGTNTTNAERSAQGPPISHSRRNSASSSSQQSFRSPWSTGRNIMNELEITLPEIKNAGKSGAELYYARFLYAFSDVIVFVTNHDQQLHKDIQRLLEWAASAVHKAINHLPRKTLIIVQNMPARHESEYYSEAFHKRSLLGSMDNIWETSKVLDAFKKRHDKESSRRENEIHSNEMFLKIFFQSVEVCYIPNKGFATAAEVIRQYRVLRNLITQAVEAGQQARSFSWTRYDVPSLSHLFGRAFHHFAKISGPFDFYTAARKDNPMSETMEDHIANLLRYMQISDVRLNGFPSVVAVCLICFVHRDFRRAIEPKEIFDRTLRRVCERTIHIYQNKYQRCAFIFPNGQPCKAIRLTHPEHCSSDEKGSKFPGSFDPAHYYETPGDTIRKIEQSFISMFKALCSHLAGGSVLRLPPSHDVAVYRQQVLNSKLLIDLKFWQGAKSNKTCFSCLQSVPDHALPCGHVYCEPCIKEFGQPDQNRRYCIEMVRCVLCLAEWPTHQAQLIQLKPKFSGVRVLTLDGGGIRGIVELAILAEVERRVGLGVPIRELFDLIVGTSTGGIIALGLAMTDFNVGEMTARFLQLSEKTFKTNRGGIWSNFDPFNVFPAVLMAVKAWESKYRTTPLREGLVDLFGKDKPMFPPTTSTGNQRTVRVTVTSTTSGDPCIFTNYNRNISTDDKDFEREDEQSQEAKVWEAALATSAAPIYFKPFQRGDPPKLYSDGALHANLPAEYALWETQKIWPTVHPDRPSDELHIDDAFGKDLISSIEALDFGDERADELDNIGGLMVQSSHRTEVHIDTLVSIGTGQQERVDKYPSAFEVGGLKQIYLSLIKAMDTEASWEDFRKKGSRKDVHQYRLNVPITGKYVALDDWDQMYRLAEAVRQEYLTNSRALNDVQDVASRLAASLLFFEPDAPDSSRLQPPDRWHRIHGQIWCRLPRDSSTIVALTDRITGFWIREDNPKMRLSHPTPVPLKDGWKSEIRTQGRHLSVPALIKTMEPDSTITLSVRLKDVESINDTLPTRERTYPISGFPILFKDLEAMVLAQ